jgi:hypothetical protein
LEWTYKIIYKVYTLDLSLDQIIQFFWVIESGEKRNYYKNFIYKRMNNTPKDNSNTGGHHGEFQKKSAHVPPHSSYRPHDRPHQNGQKTYVYRKDTSLHSIEQALDRIAMPTHAPTSSSGATNTNQGSRDGFHAKRFDRGNRRPQGRNDRPRFNNNEDRPQRQKETMSFHH